MTDALAPLLKAARGASRMDRMELRDPIASHGAAAVQALLPWLGEPEYAAFAIRTIAKAGHAGASKEAVEALLGARSAASGVLKFDIDEALKQLGYKAPAPSVAAAPSVPVSEDLYEALVDAARARKTMTYSDAGAIVGLTMRNPHHRRLLGQHLGAISAREAEHGRPMLSAVVVQKGEKRTGTGFAQLGEELGLKRSLDDDRSFDVRELHRVFEYWTKPVAQADTRTGAPDFRTRDPNDEPPPDVGPCGFATDNGQCLNPGRWDRDGVLSCTTHSMAHSPQPYVPGDELRGGEGQW